MGDQLRFGPNSLHILFRAWQTRLRHSRVNLRKKIFGEKFSKCRDPRHTSQTSVLTKMSDQLRFGPNSLGILFEAWQTRLRHSRVNLRKKIFGEKFSKCRDPRRTSQTSVLTDFKSFITFVLLGFTQWKLDIRNQRKKLYRIRLTCKITSTKNLTQNFLAKLFWVRQNFRLFFSSSDFFAKGLKRCAIKNEIDLQSLKTIGLSDKKLWAKNHVLDHTSLNIDHSSLFFSI